MIKIDENALWYQEYMKLFAKVNNYERLELQQTRK